MKRVWILSYSSEVFDPVYATKELAEKAKSLKFSPDWQIQEIDLLETEIEVIEYCSL